MSDLEKFFTRSVSEEGKKIPLSYPDGTDSPHWIRVRGVDSDTYAAESAKQRKRLLQEQAKASETGGEINEDVFEDSKRQLLASLVVDWSFDVPCDSAAVLNLLREAPQIADKINLLAADRSFFFAQEGNGSTNTPGTKPSSRGRSAKALP